MYRNLILIVFSVSLYMFVGCGKSEKHIETADTLMKEKKLDEALTE